MFPLLDDITIFWKSPSLKNTIVIGAQHLLGCTTEMFKNLCKLGLSPKNVFLIGKCYSTSQEAVEDLRSLGIYVSPSSTVFDSHRNYDELYSEHIENFLKFVLPKISEKKDHRIVILDDGGTLIKMTALLKDEYEVEVIGAVEQTSSGYNSLKEQSSQFAFPILNVARSNAKLIHESPFIAENCLNELYRSISVEKLRKSKILILGNGPLGKAIYSQIDAFFCEIVNPELLNEFDFRKKINHADVIIGCTGFTSLPSQLFSSIKPDAYLISCSSSDREFDAASFRRNIPKYSSCSINPKINGINLIRSGFPVNFNGKKFVSRLQDIELTISLLFSSILNILCIDAIPSGFTNLDPNSEKFIISKYKKKMDSSLSNNQQKIAFHGYYSELTG